MDLTDKADMKMEDYSGGMQRRLEIARGLMHHPHVLFLDEPTLGLDAQTRRHIRQYIREMNRQEGVTIILTTHYMEEADFLCDRVAIIDGGRIVALDTPGNLKGMIGAETITLVAESVARRCLPRFVHLTGSARHQAPMAPSNCGWTMPSPEFPR